MSSCAEVRCCQPCCLLLLLLLQAFVQQLGQCIGTPEPAASCAAVFRTSILTHCTPHLSMLRQAYIRQLGQCIGMLEEDESSPAQRQLKRWSVECGLLIVATAFSSPKAFQDIYHCKFDEGRVVYTELPDSFYKNLLVRSSALAALFLGAAPLFVWNSPAPG